MCLVTIICFIGTTWFSYLGFTEHWGYFVPSFIMLCGCVYGIGELAGDKWSLGISANDAFSEITEWQYYMDLYCLKVTKDNINGRPAQIRITSHYERDGYKNKNEIIGYYDIFIDNKNIGQVCLKSPSDGVLYKSSLPSGVYSYEKDNFILKIDDRPNALDIYNKHLADQRKESELRKLEQEKYETAKKIKEKERKRQLEKIVRQELIDSGELFGDEPKRPPIPREVVDAVYSRDAGKCVYCGSTENLHLDHIIPFSKGGATTIENLQILCQKCNISKSNKIG